MVGQEGFEPRPVQRRAHQRADALDRFVQRHHRAHGDGVDHRLGARADLAIGLYEVIEARPPLRLLHQPQSFGAAAAEHVAADAVARHQPRRRVTHGVKPLQPQLQAQRQFLGAGVRLLGAGQQQRGFEIGEPGRHHQIIGGEFQLELPRPFDEGQILLREREDGNFAQIDLLAARQRQQQVQRPFPMREADRQHLRPRRAAVFGRREQILAHSTVTDLARLRGWSTSVPLATAT